MNFSKILAAGAVILYASSASAGQTHAEKCRTAPDSSCFGALTSGAPYGNLPAGAPPEDPRNNQSGAPPYWTAIETTNSHDRPASAICANGYRRVGQRVSGDYSGTEFTQNSGRCSVSATGTRERNQCSIQIACAQ